MNTYQDWIVKEEEHIVHLSLNRTESGNILRIETLEELLEICVRLRTRKDIWVVVLEGKGKHFCSGFDPKLIQSIHSQSKDSVSGILRKQQHILDQFEKLEIPTIAKIHGFCIGGGFLLALCCDFRIAAKRTLFSLPEVKVGVPILWGTHRIVRHTGPSLAKELILLGERFKPDKALEWGLIYRMVPDSQLDREVVKLATKFRDLPPRTIGIAKRLVNAAYDRPAGDLLAMEQEAILEICRSPDAKEAIDSYFDKRKPRYVGE